MNQVKKLVALRVSATLGAIDKWLVMGAAQGPALGQNTLIMSLLQACMPWLIADLLSAPAK